MAAAAATRTARNSNDRARLIAIVDHGMKPAFTPPALFERTVTSA
jgi:hypothetical protein